MAEVTVEPPVGERLSVAEVTQRYLIHAERRGRKASTRKNIESEARVHLAPFFGTRSMDAIQPQDVLDFVTVLERKRLSPKSIRNVIGRCRRCSTSRAHRSAGGRRSILARG